MSTEAAAAEPAPEGILKVTPLMKKTAHLTFLVCLILPPLTALTVALAAPHLIDNGFITASDPISTITSGIAYLGLVLAIITAAVAHETEYWTSTRNTAPNGTVKSIRIIG